MVRPRDVALGVAGAVVLLIGPAPADIAALFQRPAPPCTSGCGHTDAWWDRPVLVAHADELPHGNSPHRGLFPGLNPVIRPRPRSGPAAPHRRLPG
jgi:hypothetical protein